MESKTENTLGENTMLDQAKRENILEFRTTRIDVHGGHRDIVWNRILKMKEKERL